jgi:CRP/FNR family transcriptional regulator, cyclic AMP receptor protein
VVVSAEAWARLLSSGAPRFYEPEAVLLRQGEPATHVLPLVAGHVRVTRTSRDGSVVVLGVRGPGEILGDIAVLGEGSRSATVTALERCETRIIPAPRLLILVRSMGLERQLFRHVTARIREGEAWRADLAALPAGPRLARTLIRLAIPGPDGSADVILDQAELGLAAGLSRSTVAAELGRLRKQGVVVTARRRIVITDLAGLQIVAESRQGNV